MPMSDKDQKAKSKKEEAPPDPLADLRRKAVRKLKSEEERLRGLSEQDLKALVNELGTHQIELELQNEELRRARTELEASHALYVDLYDFSPMGYFSFDRNGLIREVNLTGANMLGMEKRLVRSRLFQTFLEPDQRNVFRDHLSEVFRTQLGASCEIALRKNDGTKLHARLQSLSFVMGTGDPGVCRTAMSDITEQKRAEKEIRKLNEDLKRALQETAEVNRDLEAFSASVSHDLRAPLRSIEGFTAAILEDSAATLSAASKDYFQRILAASKRMSQLIDALLNLARLTRGQLTEKTVNLSNLAEVIAHDLRKKDPGRSVEFIIAGDVKARGDMDLLRTVLENLLHNAWKFTSKHPSATIEFGATRTQGETEYFVRDDGAGFDMSFADKLFQPFKRCHSDSEFPGIGIGLAMARRIINRHGGRLRTEAAVEKGATFYFTL
jgi:PAS domain S-box-containing protein